LQIENPCLASSKTPAQSGASAVAMTVEGCTRVPGHTSGPVGSRESDQIVRAIRPRKRASYAAARCPLTDGRNAESERGSEARRSWGNEAAIRQATRVKRLPPHTTALYAHVVDMAKKNPVLFSPVKDKKTSLIGARLCELKRGVSFPHERGS
jgi:hypothetical protein